MQWPRWQLGDERRTALWCALAVVLCVLATVPFLEVGVNDDFSYTQSAFDYARTGHIVYNGWGSPLLGWQVIWGGIVVKLWGNSFNAVRLSMLPFAAGCAYLLCRLLQRFGANTWNAVIGTLTMGLSPMFLPLSASFMTDVPALFCILLCMYMCLRAIQSTGSAHAVGWMCAAAVCNVLGGTVRQIVWFGALVMVPATAWLLRDRRWVLAVAAPLWICSIAGVVTFDHWFRKQPYTVLLSAVGAPIGTTSTLEGVLWLALLLLTLFLLMLPLLVGLLPELSTIPASRRRAAYLTVLSISAALLWGAVRYPANRTLAPWLSLAPVVSIYGAYGIPDVGPHHVVLQLWIRFGITVILVCCVVAGWAVLYSRSGQSKRNNDGLASLGSRGLVIITVPFALCYLGTLWLRGTYAFLLDRYVVPLFPSFILLFVLYYQQRVRSRLPRIAVGALIAFAIYGIAATHDYFAIHRARLAAAKELERAGVPRTSVHVSLEYDAATQIATSGYINHPGILIPAGAYRIAAHLHRPPPGCEFAYADFFPAVRPGYVVVERPLSCMQSTLLPSVAYRTWLPPFRGEVYIQKLPERYDWIR